MVSELRDAVHKIQCQRILLFFLDADTTKTNRSYRKACNQFTKCNEHFIRNIFSNLAARTTHKLELEGKPVGSASARARRHAQSVDAQPENITPPNPFYWIVGGVKQGRNMNAKNKILLDINCPTVEAAVTSLINVTLMSQRCTDAKGLCKCKIRKVAIHEQLSQCRPIHRVKSRHRVYGYDTIAILWV